MHKSNHPFKYCTLMFNLKEHDSAKKLLQEPEPDMEPEQDLEPVRGS